MLLREVINLNILRLDQEAFLAITRLNTFTAQKLQIPSISEFYVVQKRQSTLWYGEMVGRAHVQIGLAHCSQANLLSRFSCLKIIGPNWNKDTKKKFAISAGFHKFEEKGKEDKVSWILLKVPAAARRRTGEQTERHDQPDRPFYNYGALKSVARRS